MFSKVWAWTMTFVAILMSLVSWDFAQEVSLAKLEADAFKSTIRGLDENSKNLSETLSQCNVSLETKAAQVKSLENKLNIKEAVIADKNAALLKSAAALEKLSETLKPVKLASK